MKKEYEDKQKTYEDKQKILEEIKKMESDIKKTDSLNTNLVDCSSVSQTKTESAGGVPAYLNPVEWVAYFRGWWNDCDNIISKAEEAITSTAPLTDREKELQVQSSAFPYSAVTSGLMVSQAYLKAEQDRAIAAALQQCHSICKSDYNLGNDACSAGPACNKGGCVIKSKDCNYQCNPGSCGGWESREIVLMVFNSEGELVTEDTVQADAKGNFNYTFIAPNYDDTFSVKVSVPGFEKDVIGKNSKGTGSSGSGTQYATKIPGR